MDRMKRRQKRIRKRKRKQEQKKVVFVIALLCILTMAGLATRLVIAKYYAYKAEKGISVASGFYFNSDKLIKQEGGAYASPEAVQGMNTDGIPVTINREKWTGGDCLFTVEIRNFDNNLLYNEQGLDLEYKILFRLIGTPVGASYTVSGEGITGTPSLTPGNSVEGGGSLAGGAPRSHIFQIHLTTANQAVQYDNLKAAKVLVAAYPTSPDYIRTEETEKQEHFMCGMFQGVLSEASMRIESSRFQVQSTTAYKSGWQNAVKDQSGLIYTIRTGGDALIDENNSIRQKIRVKWNSQYLQVSKYDIEARATEVAKKEKEKYILINPDATEIELENVYNTKYNQVVTEWTTPVNNWITVQMETLPNTEINLTFYKTSDFVSKLGGELNKQTFEGLAVADIPPSN